MSDPSLGEISGSQISQASGRNVHCPLEVEIMGAVQKVPKGHCWGTPRGWVNCRMFIVHWMFKVCSFKNVIKQGNTSKSTKGPLFGELLDRMNILSLTPASSDPKNDTKLMPQKIRGLHHLRLSADSWGK
eukprot:1198496-Amphidinium_carterae.1